MGSVVNGFLLITDSFLYNLRDLGCDAFDKLCIRSLRHNAYKRLGARRTSHDPAVLTEYLFCVLDLCRYLLVGIKRGLTLGRCLDIDSYLRIFCHNGGELGELFARMLNDGEKLYGGHLSVARRGEIPEYDMSRLLAAER